MVFLLSLILLRKHSLVVKQGKNVPTSKKEVIGVHVQEIDGKQEAVIYDVD